MLGGGGGGGGVLLNWSVGITFNPLMHVVPKTGFIWEYLFTREFMVKYLKE